MGGQVGLPANKLFDGGGRVKAMALQVEDGVLILAQFLNPWAQKLYDFAPKT